MNSLVTVASNALVYKGPPPKMNKQTLFYLHLLDTKIRGDKKHCTSSSTRQDGSQDELQSAQVLRHLSSSCMPSRPASCSSSRPRGTRPWLVRAFATGTASTGISGPSCCPCSPTVIFRFFRFFKDRSARSWLVPGFWCLALPLCLSLIAYAILLLAFPFSFPVALFLFLDFLCVLRLLVINSLPSG